MHKFIVFQNLPRTSILGLHWQCNSKIGCKWSVNGKQYITHNNKYLCTSTASSDAKAIIHNVGALWLQPRSLSVIKVQAPTELDTQHIHQLNASDDLLSYIIPQADGHRIHDKYPKFLSMVILNTAYDAVHIPKTNVIGTWYPIEIENIEVSNVLWIKTENWSTKNSTADLPVMLSESCLKTEQSNSKQSIIIQDAHIPQEARDKLSALLEKDLIELYPSHPQMKEEPIYIKCIFWPQDHP